MYEAGETELSRIWTKVEAIRAKQAAKPTGSALPIAVSADASGRREAETPAAGEGSRETIESRAERLQAQVEELREGLKLSAADFEKLLREWMYAPFPREAQILGQMSPPAGPFAEAAESICSAHSLLSKQEKEG
jgi:hypothetical protein